MIIPARPISGKAIPKGWHGQLWDWVNSMNVSGDKKTIFVKETATGKMLSGKPFSQEQGNGNTAGGVSSGSFEYPFIIEKLTDNSVRLVGYNLTAEPARTWKNWITLGNNQLEVAEQEVGSIALTGYLYLEITYTNTYLATLKYQVGETLPTKTNANDIITVRRIVCKDGKISEINSPFNVLNLGGKVY